MSANREKERRHRRDGSRDGRPVVTQEKAHRAKKHTEDPRRRQEEKLKGDAKKRKDRHERTSDTPGAKVDEAKGSSRRDRTRTRTLSPREVKQLLPSRAACEAALASRASSREEEKGEEAEEEYEDDFEDYESDFDEDDEPEPPRVPDTPSLEESWQSRVRQREMEEVRRSIARENEEVTGRRASVAAHPPSPRGGNFVDFSVASRKQKKAKEAAAARRRGEELLSMITLDAISYNVLEIPAIPYEEFMKAFGRSNTKQVHVQTNEDDLDEETQTEVIPLANKWTQSPPEYLGSRKSDGRASYVLTREERLGVGSDVPAEEETGVPVQPRTNGLWNFLSWAGQMVLVALERRSGNFLSLENLPNHSKAVAFGDGFVSLNVAEVSFLKGRAVTRVCANAGRLLSVHVNREKSFQKSFVAVWSLRELSKPLRILVASNKVSSCCFGPTPGVLAFAGLSDGSVSLWDLREPSVYHNRVPSSPDWSLQSPTYTTAGEPRDVGHRSPVVSLRLLTKPEESFGFGDFAPLQICSLDKDGHVIIWSVIQLEKPQRNAPSEDHGLAHWGRVKLVKSSSFCVFSSLRDEIPGLYITCSDFLVNEAADDGFYVANSLGSVHHCSSYGSPMKPNFYVPAKQDAIVEATCLEPCPFDDNYFLVGCGDGTVRLHSRHQENPLICLNPSLAANEEAAAVASLAWMRMRPCVFFALDALSRINVWDLGVSDMYPEASLLLTEKRIACMSLLATTDPRQVPFVVLGTEGGGVEVHRLKRDYGCRTAGQVQAEMKMFLKYVTIL